MPMLFKKIIIGFFKESIMLYAFLLTLVGANYFLFTEVPEFLIDGLSSWRGLSFAIVLYVVNLAVTYFLDRDNLWKDSYLYLLKRNIYNFLFIFLFLFLYPSFSKL